MQTSIRPPQDKVSTHTHQNAAIQQQSSVINSINSNLLVHMYIHCRLGLSIHSIAYKYMKCIGTCMLHSVFTKQGLPCACACMCTLHSTTLAVLRSQQPRRTHKTQHKETRRHTCTVHVHTNQQTHAHICTCNST